MAEGKVEASKRTGSNVVLWQMVRKYWPTALFTLAVVIVSVTFYTLGQKKIFEAEATIQFNPNPPRPLGRGMDTLVDMGTGTYWNNQEYYETQYRIITSMRVAIATVQELGLQHDQHFLQDLPAGGEPKPVEQRVSVEKAARMLTGRLSVQPVKDSRLATVKLQGADPKRATRILSTLVEIYIQQNLEYATDSTANASEWLRAQLDTLKNDLEESELALHGYKRDNDILSQAFDDKSHVLRERVQFLNSELSRVQAEGTEVATRKRELDKVDANDPAKITSSELIRDPMLTTLRQNYIAAVTERDALIGGGKGKSHPDVVASEAKVQLARKAVTDQINNVKDSVAGEYSRVAQRAGGINAMITDSNKRAENLKLLEIDYRKLNRQKENTEKLYSRVLERAKEADLAQALRVNNIRMLDRPFEPKSAVYPKVPLNIAAGVFAGLLLGVAAAFMRGLLDRTLKVPDDIEIELGATFLGLLPNYERNAKGVMDPTLKRQRRKRGQRVPVSGKPELIVHDQPSSSMAEASRAIRTNLIFMAPDNPHKVLLVTSPGPREGKTTVACCIAVAMAQAGQSVLVLDCDLRRPRMHRIFGGNSERGVTTALLDGNVKDAIVETEVPNMSLLPCGPVPPNPAEIFHSERFRNLLEKVKGMYDRVIIDSPPVVAVTDAAILSTLVDGTVLIGRAFATRKDFARHAVRSIRDVGGNIAGCILNAVDFSRSEYKYSYYYYRRYGYYSSDTNPESGQSDKLLGDDDYTGDSASA